MVRNTAKASRHRVTTWHHNKHAGQRRGAIVAVQEGSSCWPHGLCIDEVWCAAYMHTYHLAHRHNTSSTMHIPLCKYRDCTCACTIN